MFYPPTSQWEVNYWVRVSYIDSSGNKIINPYTGNDYCDYPFTIGSPVCGSTWNTSVTTSGCTGSVSWGPGCIDASCASYGNDGPNDCPCWQDPQCNGYYNSITYGTYPCSGNSLPWDCGNY